MWEVEFTDEFGAWWESLTEDQQDAIDRAVGVLRRFYDRLIPIADDLYDVYLAELRKEGLV